MGRVAMFLVALALALATHARAVESTVILLSWDGVRWDYPDRAEFPGLARMARDGVRAGRLIPVFPSSTFPNHVSLATGAYVERHGIVGNVFQDPELGRYAYSKEARFIKAEPIWVTAERQGVRAASYFWVGSETDWNGTGATYRKTPFDGRVPESQKVDQILAWLELPAERRPRLVLSYWRGADEAGHRHGPDSQDVVEALRGQDAELQRLLAALDQRGAWAYTTLLIVSDHGMATAGSPLDVEGPLERAGIRAHVSRAGGSGLLSLDDPARLDEALELLNRIDGLHAYANDHLPEPFHSYFPGRSGQVTLVPVAPAVLWEAQDFTSWVYVYFQGLLGNEFGLHGYPPEENADMHAIFFALGRGVPAGLQLDRVSAIDVAPTVARLLGISPPAQSQGRAIKGIGSPTRDP